MSEKKAEKINLTERVWVKLIEDMPSMRKYKGDYLRTHPKNIKNLIEGGQVAKDEKGVKVNPNAPKKKKLVSG